jgi:hypothetical protein
MAFRARRLTAAATVLFWIGGILLQVAGSHVVDTADAAAGDRIWGNLQTTARLSVPDAVANEHCPICHLTRAVRSAVLSSGSTLDQVETWTPAVVAVGVEQSKYDLEQRSSRAPPVVL